MRDASSKQETKQKYKLSHQQTGLPPRSALPIRRKTNKQKLSTNLTLYEAYTNHWTNLRRAETKRKKKFNLEAWEKETSNTISKNNILKRQRNNTQMKEQTRNTEVPINEEVIGKLPEKVFRIMIVKMIKKKPLKTKCRKCKNQLTKTYKN